MGIIQARQGASLNDYRGPTGYKIYRNGHLRVEALSDIDMAVEQGEMVAIMGPRAAVKRRC